VVRRHPAVVRIRRRKTAPTFETIERERYRKVAELVECMGDGILQNSGILDRLCRVACLARYARPFIQSFQGT
jgi:hypothetical protein